MNYATIRKMDISNGPGVRVSLFVSGCTFKCPGCFNYQAWDFKYGNEFTDETVKFILDLCVSPEIKGISILGGEPLHPNNVATVENLLIKFREVYPDKTIWVWTGFNFEDISTLSILKQIDVLVDGRFKEELADWHLLYRGSSNQRVIDVKTTLKTGEIVQISEKLDSR